MIHQNNSNKANMQSLTSFTIMKILLDTILIFIDSLTRLLTFDIKWQISAWNTFYIFNRGLAKKWCFSLQSNKLHDLWSIHSFFIYFARCNCWINFTRRPIVRVLIVRYSTSLTKTIVIIHLHTKYTLDWQTN